MKRDLFTKAAIRSQFVAAMMLMGVCATPAAAQLGTGLVGYYNFGGNLTNTDAAIGGTGGAADAAYGGSGSLRYVTGDNVLDTESFFGADGPASVSVTGDSVYFGGDNGDDDFLTIPGLTLGDTDFTITIFAAMGDDQSPANSGSSTLGGNGPTILSTKAVRFDDDGAQLVTNGTGTGFAYGVWSDAGDDYGLNVGDGTTGLSAGDDDVGFDLPKHFAVVYDATAKELRRYQENSVDEVIDVSSLGSFNSGVDLHIGGFPEGSTSGSDTYWGAIDEVGVWDRALSNEEILTVATYGDFFLDLEDAVNGVPLPIANFTGDSSSDNLASNGGNWDLDPLTLGTGAVINVDAGTTDTFGGANTGPAVFDSSFGEKHIRNLQVGLPGSGSTVHMEMSGTAELIGDGDFDSEIGGNSSTVFLTMSGSSRIEHNGGAEEDTELEISEDFASVTIVMNDSSEIASGVRGAADPTYASGFAPPATVLGDDLKLGVDGDLDVTMNNNSLIFVSDVLYPTDADEGNLTFVQNDNSQVVTNWDSRWHTAGGSGTGGQLVDWTLNDSSRFVAARDHGIGETTNDRDDITIHINDNAEFYAGDRIVIGAGGGGDLIVNVNGGLMKVGGDSPSDELKTYDSDNPTLAPLTADWILHMGGGALNAVLNVQGGDVEIGRNAYIGRGGGKATVNITSGSFNIKGVGPSIAGLGNGPGGGVPVDVLWSNSGGDLIIGDDDGDRGYVNYTAGDVNVARDVILAFDNDFSASAGFGQIRVDAEAGAATPGNAFDVGRDLLFAGDGFAASGTGAEARLMVGVNSGALSPIDVAGSVTIYNDSGSLSTISMGVANGSTRTPGAVAATTYQVITHVGSRTGTFVETDHGGVDFSVTYNANNIEVTPTFVYAFGDADKSQAVDGSDLTAITTAAKHGTGLSSATWAEGDFDDDDDVDGADLLLASPLMGVGDYLANSAGSATPTGTAIYDPATGALSLSADFESFDSFVIQSDEEGLLTGIAGFVDVGGAFQIDSAGEISENFFSSAVTAGNDLDLGAILATGLDLSVLEADLTILGGLTGEQNFEFSIELLTLLPGDFDLDGDVDGDDLVVWETSFGVGNGADANGDGDSDGGDFLTWQRNFTGPSPLSGAAAVPEPTALVLISLACMGLASQRRTLFFR